MYHIYDTGSQFALQLNWPTDDRETKSLVLISFPLRKSFAAQAELQFALQLDLDI